ncbi:MAG TPA: lipid II flippase MurJ [Ktedonobacterales bacterium]
MGEVNDPLDADQARRELDDELAALAFGPASSYGGPPRAQEELAHVAEPTAGGAAAPVAEHRIMASAAVITAGSLTSSLLGMVRIETVNAFFYGGASGAFTTALRPVQQVSDLIVAGSVSGALIPTFVDYSPRERRQELAHVYSTVANLVTILMIAGMVGIALAAPFLVPFGTRNFSHADQQLTIQLVQVAALSLLGLGLFAVASALLYALKLVVYPAFATGLYHVGVIGCGLLVLFVSLAQAHVPVGLALRPGLENPAVVAARAAGAHGLALGAGVGALGEFIFLLPGLRKLAVTWRPVLDLRHPAVRQILRLYAPLATGLIISVAAQNLDIVLIGMTPGNAESNATSWTSAVTLIQFPIGLVSAALSFVMLPLLTTAANARDTVGFKRTLVMGFRLGLLLMVPAMVGLLVLRVPIMALLFQHGRCGHGCTVRNVLAVQNMAYQLPFIAMDQLLIAAYYARKNTLIPTLASIAGVACYALAAVPFAQTIGLPAVSFANAVQNASHAIILLVLLTLTIGNLGFRQLGDGVARIALAAVAMAAVSWGLLLALPRVSASFFTTDHALGNLVTVAVVGSAGLVVYFAIAGWLRLGEVTMLGTLLRSRLGR